MNLFGWIFLILTILGAIGKISEMGRPRKPLTSAEVTLTLLASGLIFWGLYAWGLH